MNLLNYIFMSHPSERIVPEYPFHCLFTNIILFSKNHPPHSDLNHRPSRFLLLLPFTSEFHRYPMTCSSLLPNHNHRVANKLPKSPNRNHNNAFRVAQRKNEQLPYPIERVETVREKSMNEIIVTNVISSHTWHTHT